MFKQIIISLLLLPSLVFASDFIAGKDYQVITPNQEVTSKKSLIEFFSYGCPWCYQLDKPVTQWMKAKPEQFEFQGVPVVFNKDWEIYAKAYYAAQLLGLSDRISPLLFKAIQVEKKPLNQKQNMIEFFIAQGVKKDIAVSAFEHSPAVDLQVKKGMMLMASYHINAVPAFVVNNRYKTDLQMAKSPERLLELLTYLLNK